jgi:hypothetical protein
MHAACSASRLWNASDLQSLLLDRRSAGMIPGEDSFCPLEAVDAWAAYHPSVILALPVCTAALCTR